MDPAKGFIGKPRREQIPQLCGRCHSDAQFMKQYNPALRVDQVAEYATSVHGRRLRELGDPKVAVCVSCHPAHSIRPPSDPQSTVHPLHVAETCGRCHADAKYMAELQDPDRSAREVQDERSRQGDGGQGRPGGADVQRLPRQPRRPSPPGIAWVGNVCGQCHSVTADLFKKSVHAKAFAEMGSPGCATCHENHAIKDAGDAMLGLGDKAVCATCHSADDKGGKSAAEMRALVDSLAAATDRAPLVLDKAERAGLEVSQGQFDLSGAREGLVKARTAVHAFAVGAVTQEVQPGLAIAEKATARGARALEDLRLRKAGLGVSLVIIVALMAGLVVKIREVDRRGAAPKERGDT